MTTDHSTTTTRTQNLQTGDNTRTIRQEGQTHTGDFVGGQVTAWVAPPGGTINATLHNRSNDVHGTTGDTIVHNADAGFIGLNVSGCTLIG